MTGTRFYLHRIRLNQGGYDCLGRYWGTGAPLYMFAREDDAHSGYLRAATREDAKAQVRDAHPGARFFR